MDPLNHVVIMIMQEPKLESNPFFFFALASTLVCFFLCSMGGVP